MATDTTGTFRSIQPNDVVVPFSDIATLLRNRLSGAEIDDLLSSLIRSRSRVVQPGDLITADWAMDVMNRLSLLERGASGASVNSVNQRAIDTLLEAADMFGRLAIRQRFFPDGSDNDAMRTASKIELGLQGVAITAISGATIAYSVDTQGLLDVFQRLYSGEHDLAVVLASSLPGVSNAATRLLFAQRLNSLLETNEAVSGKLSLHNALDAGDLDAAIDAQDRVNGIVVSEAGEAVVGTIEVSYRTSTRGEALVVGDGAAFGFIFRVVNKTNKRLDAVTLEAGFVSPRDAWNGSVSIVGGAGRVLSLKPYDSSQPDDPGAFQDVQVNVTTPAGAKKGDTATLKLSAIAPAPVSVGGFDTRILSISDQAVAPQASTVKFSDASPVVEEGTPANATVDESIMYRFDMRYTSTVSSAPRDFRLRVSTSNTAADFAAFTINFDPNLGADTAPNSKTKLSKSFPLADGQPAVSQLIQVIPGSGAKGKTLNLDFDVEAVDDATVTDTKSRSITVRP